MTEFNPFLPQPSIPDWTNAPGRLIDGSGLGEIFGKVASGASELFAKENEKRVSNKLYDEADKAAEAGRIESMAQAAGVPPDLAKSMDRAELMGKAFKNGNYSPALFYSKMDVWSKEVKARYPQYKDIIDQQIGRVMGRTPANEELDAVRKTWEDAVKAKQTAQGKDWTFLNENAQYFDGDVVANWDKLGDDQKTSAKKLALMRKGDQARFDQEKKNLETIAKAGALEAAPALSVGIANLQREFWTQAVKDGGGNLASLQQTISKFAEGGFSAEEMTQIKQIVDQRKQKLMADFTNMVTTPDESGRSLQDYFANDPAAWNAQKAKVDEMMKGLDDLSQGKTGYVEWMTTMSIAEQDTRMRALREKIGAEAYDGIKAMQDLLPSDVSSTLLMNASAGDGNPLQTMMNGLVKGMVLSKGNIGDGVQSVTDNADPSTMPQVNKAARQMVEDTIKTAVDPKLPIEARAKALDTVLQDTENKFIRTLKDVPDNTGLSSREKFFKRMTNPEIAQAAKQLGKEKEYTAWVKNSAVALYSGNVEQVNATNETSKYIDIRFNPNTMQFEATLNKSLVKDPKRVADYVNLRRQGKQYASLSALPGDIPVADLDAIKDGMDSVQKLNMINAALVEAIKAEKPGAKAEDIAKELQGFMGDLKASYSKQDPWQIRALQAIGKAMLTPWEEGKTKPKPNGEDFGVVPGGDVNFNVAEGKGFDGLKTAEEKMPVLMGNLQNDLGLSNIQAAGIIGNLAHESAGLQPGIAGDSGAAHGWAQWNGPRKKQMIEWSQSQGLDPSSDEANYAFLIHDLSVNYPDVLAKLKQARTVEEATKIIMDDYERPRIPHEESRLQWANKALT